MSPGGPYAQQAELQKMIDSINKAKDQAYQTLERVHTGVNRFLWIAGTAAATPILGPIAPATIWWVYHNWDKIKEWAQKIFKVLETVLRNGTPVLSLIHHSFAWVGDVMSPTSGLSNTVNERADVGLMEWKGTPADRYKEIRTSQKVALDEMVNRSNYISKWLMTIVQGNMKYAEQVYKIVTSFVGALISAAAKAATVITIPLALETLESQLGKIVESELNLLMTIAQRVVDSLAGMRDAMAMTGNLTILSADGWPNVIKGN
jgi:hypothetical protein